MVVLLKSGAPEKNKRSLSDKIKQLNLSSEQEAFLLSVLEDNVGESDLPPARKQKEPTAKKRNKQGK